MGKVPLTTRAVIQRVNRKLKPEWQCLRMCRRNSRWWSNLGDFYVIDTYKNMIVDDHVDPETYGRDLGVVRPFEQVVTEGTLAVAAGR